MENTNGPGLAGYGPSRAAQGKKETGQAGPFTGLVGPWNSSPCRALEVQEDALKCSTFSLRRADEKMKTSHKFYFI